MDLDPDLPSEPEPEPLTKTTQLGPEGSEWGTNVDQVLVSGAEGPVVDFHGGSDPLGDLIQKI